MFGASSRRLVLGTVRQRTFISSRSVSAASLVPVQQSQLGTPERNERCGWSRTVSIKRLTSRQTARYFSSDDLPYHLVVGMPALSPTMESGSIEKWNVAEGDSFSAGDSLAVIETDKATIDFEAQDDGVVAKLLVSEGDGDINVGLPIMVTVEEEDDVAAFANFAPDSSGGSGEAAPASTETPSAPPATATTPAEDLPYHIVVGMPALSPTMDAGTISSWNVKAGDSISAGDSIAVIETDKASIDFEAQDDAVIAKLLVEAGSGEVAVGVPIMVTVEEESDVAAFQDFVPGNDDSGSSDPVEAETPAPVAVAEGTAPEPAAATVPTPQPVTPTLTAQAIDPPSAPMAPVGAIFQSGSSWGNLAAVKSPLAKALADKQREYTSKYGSTGHVPVA